MKIAIGLTGLCDHNCWFCYASASADNNRFIPSGEIVRFIHDAFHYYKGNVSFPLGGGEPALHPDFEDMIKEIESISVPYSVTTNLDHPERIHHIRKGWLWGSIHSPEEVDKIVTILKESKNSGANVLVMRSYRPYIYDVLDILSENNIPFILTFFKPYGRAEGKNKETLSREEKTSLIKEIYTRYNRPVATDSCQFLSVNERCNCGVSWVTISPDREVKPNSFHSGIPIPELTLDNFLKAYREIPKKVHVGKA